MISPRRRAQRGSALIALLALVGILATIVACVANASLGRVQLAWRTRTRMRQSIAAASAQAVWSSCASSADPGACFGSAGWTAPAVPTSPWLSCYRQGAFAYEVRVVSQGERLSIDVAAAPQPPPSGHPCRN